MSNSNVCEDCGAEVHIGDHPYCPHGSTLSHRPFPAQDVELDGKTYRIDSIQAADRIEREYAKRAANEPGVGPIAFRAFHQSGSNQDRNSFGPPPFQKFNRKKLQVRRGRP